MFRFSKIVLLGLMAMFAACAALLYLRMRLAAPTGKLEISVSGASRKPPELSPGEPPTNPTLTIEELLADPQSHSHTMVRVSGCYVTMFEMSELSPCGEIFHIGKPFVKDEGDQHIWVGSARDFELLEKIRQREKLRTVKLLFAYDKGRDSRAWQKLEASTSSEVVLLGQFETKAQGFGFGHQGAYAHELILVDVMNGETIPKR